MTSGPCLAAMSLLFNRAIDKLAAEMRRELSQSRDWANFPQRAFEALHSAERKAVADSSDTDFVNALAMAAVR